MSRPPAIVLDCSLYVTGKCQRIFRHWLKEIRKIFVAINERAMNWQSRSRCLKKARRRAAMIDLCHKIVLAKFRNRSLNPMRMLPLEREALADVHARTLTYNHSLFKR